MDLNDERTNELIALNAIYYDTMNVIVEKPLAKFSIKVQSEEYDKHPNDCLQCTLLFTHTENYPNELPVIEIVDAVNINREDLLNHILLDAESMLGMVMVFSLVTAAQEWINERWDRVLLHKEELKIIEQERLSQEEKRKFEGTLLTVASFVKWKNQFDEEMKLKKKLVEKSNQNCDTKRLTGREQFMQDKSLINSDLQFIDDIKIDESLFQQLDDLELLSDDSYDDEEEDGGTAEDEDSDSDDSDYTLSDSCSEK